MSYSKTHQRFADNLRNQRALSHPEEFLGPNWKDVLNFWFYIDTLSLEQFEIARSRFWNLDVADRKYVEKLICDASCDVTSEQVSDCLYMSTLRWTLTNATLELIGAHKILEQSGDIRIVQLFLEL
jgi:hypothetical protein